MLQSRRSASVLLVGLLASLLGCGGYGDVSPAAYAHAKSLYTITSRQIQSKLDPAAEQIETARTAGELPEQEAAWLLAIIADARSGDWKAANQAARRMMEDQIR